MKTLRRMMNLAIASGFFVFAGGAAFAEENARSASFHGGFFHPAGVDVAGYTVEHRWRGVYPFYTFGIPSFAAAGLAVYQNHARHGAVATAGLGIGSIGYASVAYQWKIREDTFLKAGAGYATGIAYSGVFPVVSIEWRRK